MKKREGEREKGRRVGMEREGEEEGEGEDAFILVGRIKPRSSPGL